MSYLVVICNKLALECASLEEVCAALLIERIISKGQVNVPYLAQVLENNGKVCLASRNGGRAVVIA